MNDLIIVGAGNPEIVKLIDVINQKEKIWKIIGFVDDDKSKHRKEFMGYHIIGEIGILQEKNYRDCFVINAVARDTKIRMKVSEKLEDLNVKFATLIHPSVDLKYAEVGYDTIIYEGVVVSPMVKIGKHCDILFNSIIAHESVIGNYVFISPGTTINGRVKIHDGVFIGAGAVIISNKTIEEWSMVGVGSVVLNDVPSYSTVIGNPARVMVIKKVNKEDDE